MLLMILLLWTKPSEIVRMIYHYKNAKQGSIMMQWRNIANAYLLPLEMTRRQVQSFLQTIIKRPFQNLCLTHAQLNCSKSLKVDFSECFNKCEGMEVISYDREEIDSMLSKTLSKNGIKFDKNPILTRQVSKLSDQYNRYKEKYNFTEEYKGIKNISTIKSKSQMSYHLDFVFASKLYYVKISFNTPKFEKITKDRAAKFVDMLSAIGGTMGLLTGFSIISAVEILYFLFKIVLSYFQKLRTSN